VLNEDFRMTNANADETIDIFKDRAADLEIEFCLAQENPEGLPTSGIVYYPTDVSYFPRPVLENQFTDSIKFAALGGADVWNRDNYLNIKQE